ncbi:hypothetical protein GT348_07045 [Aristophania vespae]|uniref:Uncharacterized protein n=1 Tax=Aristophania vespae TaxID=2697033 RepID=A0A6P1NER1_9PROT|nr:hypothetical protein [Aristophania vespae]QHI96019.1 hypothetical protein GT348_07045 [Aristophania vespae]UMM63787.1 hypothetical protein DM15PD_07640 [Aristophania vespae]
MLEDGTYAQHLASLKPKHHQDSIIRIPPFLAESRKRFPVEINMSEDLWKYALLIMSVSPGGKILTRDLIDTLPCYVKLPEPHKYKNRARANPIIFQLVRNLKSHKSNDSNFIYQKYAQDIPFGFKITSKGREFVKNYFKLNPPFSTNPFHHKR